MIGRDNTLRVCTAQCVLLMGDFPLGVHSSGTPAQQRHNNRHAHLKYGCGDKLEKIPHHLALGGVMCGCPV